MPTVKARIAHHLPAAFPTKNNLTNSPHHHRPFLSNETTPSTALPPLPRMAHMRPETHVSAAAKSAVAAAVDQRKCQ